MFSSEPMNLVYDNIRKTTISSTAPFTGIIRLAYIPAKDQSDTSTEASTGLRRLIYHAGVYPIGGQVSWEFHSSPSSYGKGPTPLVNNTSRFATVHFTYTTRTMTESSLRPNAATNGLLMLALPHHAQLLPKSVLLNWKHFDLSYRCIKGSLTPVVGSTWSYDEPLLDLEFDGPIQDVDPGVRQSIMDQVEEDLTRVLPTATENIYGFGKQVARLAQLAHIADRLQTGGENAEPDDQASYIVEKATSLLSHYLEIFLTGEVADGLLFDSNLGGLVSNNGLSEKGEDFGNGR
jgi:endoglucanase Acf2